MLRRIGGLSGLFVLLTLGWYLVFPFVTGCGSNTTAPETEECEELITPVMSFLCALPPLMIAVFVFIATHGRKPKTMLQLPTVDGDGKMHLPAGVQQVEETIKQTQLAQSGMGIGGVMMTLLRPHRAGGVLMILLGSFCAMGGASNCSDDEFEWLISSIKFGNLGIKLGLVVFCSQPSQNWRWSINSKAGPRCRANTNSTRQSNGGVSLPGLWSKLALPR